MKKRMYEDYDIFKTSSNKRFSIRIFATIALYISLYISVFLLGDYELCKTLLNMSQENSYIINSESELLEELENETGIDTHESSNLVILSGTLNNNNLEDEDKALLYDLSDMIAENPYIDKNLSYKNLKELKIEYTKRPDKYDYTIVAIFDLDKRTIFEFEAKENINIEILIHELVHSIFTNYKTLSLPDYLVEGCTELLTNEYFAPSPFVEKNTYPYEVTMVKMLCDMVGADKVLEAYTTGNLNVIKNELSITMGHSKSNDFMNNIDTIFRCFKNKTEIPVDSFNATIEFMDNYYLNKMVDDNTFCRYLYNREVLSLIHKENPHEKYLEYISNNGVYIKPYFSRKLKEQNPSSFKAYIESDNDKILVKK